MKPFTYHAGQRAIQQEAKTTELADKLSGWVGPVARYAERSDLILLARYDLSDGLQTTVLSGAAPLVTAQEVDEEILVRFPQTLAAHIPAEALIGGIVMCPSEYVRARLYGTLKQVDGALEVRCQNAIINCRKYIYPSAAEGRALQFGPHSRCLLPGDDPQSLRILANTTTSFLVTVQPDGTPDVSHRGGEPGFLEYDPAARRIQWTEYFGDGLFMSAGNIRATRKFNLIALDLETGDGIELVCVEGGYHNLRPSRTERSQALIQNQRAFEVQGQMVGTVEAVYFLHQLCYPRQRIGKKEVVTACSTVEEQNSD